MIHLLGDAFAPPLLGLVAGHSNMNVAFFIMSATMLVAGLIWLMGMKYLGPDTATVEAASAQS